MPPAPLNPVPSFIPLVLTSISAGVAGDAGPAVSPLEKLQSKPRILFCARSTFEQSRRKPGFLIAALLQIKHLSFLPPPGCYVGLVPTAGPVRTQRGRMGPCRDGCGSRDTQVTPPEPLSPTVPTSTEVKPVGKWSFTRESSFVQRTTAARHPQKLLCHIRERQKGTRRGWGSTTCLHVGLGEHKAPLCIAPQHPLRSLPHPRSSPGLGVLAGDRRKRKKIILAPLLSPSLTPSAGAGTHTCPHAQRLGASALPRGHIP